MQTILYYTRSGNSVLVYIIIMQTILYYTRSGNSVLV